MAGFKARDGYFVISVLREHHFQILAEFLGHPEWPEDPRFATRQGWAAQIDPLVRPALEHWARDKSKLEASSELCAQGLAAGPSNLAQDICSDPHVEARGMILEVPRPDDEKPMRIHGNPVKLSRVAEGPVRRFPRLGEHTTEVLREVLDLPEAELAELRAQAAIA